MDTAYRDVRKSDNIRGSATALIPLMISVVKQAVFKQLMVQRLKPVTRVSSGGSNYGHVAVKVP